MLVLGCSLGDPTPTPATPEARTPLPDVPMGSLNATARATPRPLDRLRVEELGGCDRGDRCGHTTYFADGRVQVGGMRNVQPRIGTLEPSVRIALFDAWSKVDAPAWKESLPKSRCDSCTDGQDFLLTLVPVSGSPESIDGRTVLLDPRFHEVALVLRMHDYTESMRDGRPLVTWDEAPPNSPN